MRKSRFYIPGIVVALVIISITAYHFYKKSAPRRTAARYLRAARANDLEELKGLSYPTHWGEIEAKGVAVRPVTWQFVSEARSSQRKRAFDLSQAAYKKEVASALHLYDEPKVEKLIDPALKKRLSSYGSWRAENIATYSLFEDNGRFYYTDDTPRVKFVVGVTEKEGGPSVEYLLVVEQKSSGEGRWEVTEFRKR